MASRTITLTSKNDDVFKVHAPEFYKINKNLGLFQDASEAILHRFIYEEFAIVAPDPWINLQLTGEVYTDNSCYCTWSDGVNGTDVKTITYVASDDSTYNNSMSLFSKSSFQKSDVTVQQDDSAEIFSTNRESSVETCHSSDETLSSSTGNDENEASSAKSERILKRKSSAFHGFSLPCKRPKEVFVISSDSDTDQKVFMMMKKKHERQK